MTYRFKCERVGSELLPKCEVNDAVDEDGGNVDELADNDDVFPNFLAFNISRSEYVNKSTNTLSLSLEKEDDSIFTNMSNFLKLPALCVISSISV